MKLIVGLGNPGKEYAHTRHNIGWDAVSVLAEKLGANFQEKTRFQAELAEGRVGEEKTLLIKPLTYMNLSGQAVRSLCDFYKIGLSDVLVVHDEMDYPFQKLAFCAEGGAAGHNGIRSIQESFGTEKIARLRMGIDRPQGMIAKEVYVLQRFSKEEEPLLKAVLERTTMAIEDWCAFGTERAMNKWNGA